MHCNVYFSVSNFFSDQQFILQYCNTSWNNRSSSQLWGHPNCPLCNSGRQHFSDVVLQNGLSHLANKCRALHFIQPQLAASRQSNKQVLNIGYLIRNATNPATSESRCFRGMAQNCKKQTFWFLNKGAIPPWAPACGRSPAEPRAQSPPTQETRLPNATTQLGLPSGVKWFQQGSKQGTSSLSLISARLKRKKNSFEVFP